MNWAIFATIYAQIGPPVIGMVDAIIAEMSGAVTGPLKAGIVVWVAGMMLANAINPEGNPLTELEKTLIKCGIGFVVATQVAEYNRIFRDIFLTNLSTDISRRVTGVVGGVAIGPAAFDAIWNKAYASGLSVLNDLSWNDFGMQLLVIIYFLVALGAIGLGFGFWTFAFIALALLISVGPLFVALFPFPATRQYFMNWISAMLHSVITQVLLAVMLVLLIGAEDTIIGKIAAQGGGNAVKETQLLLGGGFLFAVCAYIISQIPGIASSIASGAVLRGPSIVRGAITAYQVGRGMGGESAAAPPAPAPTPAAATATPMPPGRSSSAAAP